MSATGLPFELTPEQMQANYNKFLESISLMFESRSTALMTMYKDCDESLMMAPASGTEHFHNAFPGGYVDHVLRVLEFSFQVYELWKRCGIDVSTFTPEELGFVAIHHDLGKLGLPGKNNERYIWNTSDWHRKNMGKIYDTNPNIPFMTVQDMSLYMLQRYGVPLTFNETLGIKLHDGLYEESNEAYYISRSHKSGLRSYLPHIIHQADLMASRFEYDRWAAAAGQKLKPYRQ